MSEQPSKTAMILTGGGIMGAAYENGQAITARNQVMQAGYHLTLAKFMSNYEKLAGSFARHGIQTTRKNLGQAAPA